jgi:hypothetical protein
MVTDRVARRQSRASGIALVREHLTLEFSRRYVISAWGFGLHAYDPKTGERAWHIGGR